MKTCKALHFIGAVVCMLGLGTGQVAAATFTWNAGAAGNASVQANWLEDGGAPTRLPGAGDSVVLDDTSTFNMTWNGGADSGDGVLTNTVASWTQTADYVGTVAIWTTYPEVATTFTNFTITGNASLAGGTWTHRNDNNAASAPYQENSRLHVTVQGNLEMTGLATINTDGRGFNEDRGPGASGNNRTSASHGGLGTDMSPVYGSITDPTRAGSGGGGGGAAAGGGVVMLVVNGALTIGADAVITADGAHNVAEGTGSGGSVNIRTGTLNGSGTIRANGGNSTQSWGYNGAGGRIAVILRDASADFASWSGSIIARTGTNGSNNGAAGTVYLQTGDAFLANQVGTLVVNNGGCGAGTRRATIMPTGTDLADFSAVIVTNQACLSIDASHALTWADMNLLGAGSADAFFTVRDDAQITWPETLSITNYTLLIDAPSTTLTNVVVENGGILSHSANGGAALYKLDLTIHGDLTVKDGGHINVEGKGFSRNRGPGSQDSSGNSRDYIGGSYGGIGGDGSGSFNPGPTYGSIVDPIHLGSGGGGGPGGGAVLLDVAGTTTIESGGSINADANTTSLNNGGAGGSVYLRTLALDGGGQIRANGGPSGNPRVSGAGGRVAVILRGSGETFADFEAAGGAITANGSQNSSSGGKSAAGTVYLETGDDYAAGGNAGTAIVKSAIAAPRSTHLPPTYVVGDAQYAYSDDLTAAILKIDSNGRAILSGDLHVKGLRIDNAAARFDLNGHKIFVDGSPLVVTNTIFSELGSYSAAWLQAEKGFTQIIDSDAGGGGLVVLTMGIPPEITTDPPADLTATSATLRGTLVEVGSSEAAVNVYWGLTEGGLASTAWDANHQIASIIDDPQPGLYTHSPIGSLIANRVYFYRFGASNVNLTVWADMTERFLTGEVAIEKIADADEVGLAPGSYRFSRHADATNGAITVYYTIDPSSTAAVNVNYEPLAGFSSGTGTGTIVLAEGQAETTLTVTPLVEADNFSDTALTLNLAADPRYLIDAGNASASMTIFTVSYPAAPTNTWIGSGNASDAANWSLGVVPDAGHDVLLEYYSTANMVWDYDGINGLTNVVASWTQGAGYTGAVSFNAPFSVTGDAQLDGGTWTRSGSVMTLDVTVGHDLRVGAGAVLNMDGRGFGRGAGPGGAAGVGVNDYVGGSHGGRGADTGENAYDNGPCYGSILAPVAPGSGGSNPGGGVIILAVTGDSVIDGAVTAIGEEFHGGAGGSIFLTTRSLSGSGSIDATGGFGPNPRVAGGGGRVAVILTGSGEVFDAVFNAGGVIRAPGGDAAGNERKGAAGTVYLETVADGPGAGTIRVDNSNRETTTAVTELPPPYAGATYPQYWFADNLSKAALTVSSRGKVHLKGTLTVQRLTLESSADPLDLAGQTLHTRALTIAGDELGAGTYSAADLVALGYTAVIDSSDPATGKIVLPAPGTLFLMR